MKVSLPAVLRIDRRNGGNTIQQMVVPPIKVHGEFAKFISPDITGWLFTPADNSPAIHICQRPPKARLDSVDARVLVLSTTLTSQKDVDASAGKWWQHPELLLSSAPVQPERQVADALASWDGAFKYIIEDEQRGIVGLRLPQAGALHAIQAHWSISDGVATIVMPTGTGKTETMLATMVSSPCARVLVIVPTDALRTQIADKFLSLGVLKLQGCDVLSALARRPVVGVLRNRPKERAELDAFFEACNVVVTTTQIAGQCNEEIQNGMALLCTHLFVDEAHHVEAPTWKAFKQRFSARRILQFTATPFREDGRLVDGKIIYAYPLRKAQQEGYFRPIRFAAIFEFNADAADAAIANAAIAELRADITGKHVVMARVGSKARAKEVFAIYEAAKEFNPVLLHTGVSPRDREEAKRKLFAGESRIVVCVDMLGEGFDMPELKIAAFHDIRKSLSVTLQLAGRFTRARLDLGSAVFIANVAAIEVKEELRTLYTQDPDWNALLPELSESAIDDEVVTQEFLAGFGDFPADMPLKDLRPAASTVVYKTNCVSWTPRNFKAGLRGSARYDQVHHTINTSQNTVVIVTGSGSQVVWADLPSIRNWTWDLYIAFWDPKLQLLFIHGSSNNGEFKDLAKALCGDSVQLVVDPVLYRCLHGINRMMLTNVGLDEHFGRQIRYTGRMGADVGSRLPDATKQKARKSVLAGVGFENGGQASIGAAKRGRVWSAQRLRVDAFTSWCQHVGAKVIDDRIDPEEVLKGTLIPVIAIERPRAMPIAIDWPSIVYGDMESATWFTSTGTVPVPLTEVGIALVDESIDGPLMFAVFTETWRATFRLELPADDATVPDFRFSGVTAPPLRIRRGPEVDLCSFFESHPPSIWFADGSSLEGHQHVEVRATYLPYDPEKLRAWDWTGVDIHKESQGQDRASDSVQFRTIRELSATGDYSVVFDDDGAGEAADIVAIRLVEAEKRTTIEVEFYHCKFSAGAPGARVEDLYELRGQGQKSVGWLYSQAKRVDLFTHLLKREAKRVSSGRATRFEVGDQAKLVKIRDMSRVSAVKLSVFLVQPGLSKAKASGSQLALLSVTEHYLAETYQLPFAVIVSA